MDNILEKINKVGLKFLTPLSLQQTYVIVVEEAVKLIGAESAALYLMENNRLVRAAYYPTTVNRLIQPRKKGFTYQAYKKKKTLVVYPKQFAKVYPKLKKGKFKSAIFIPISHHHQSIGTLSLLLTKDERFSDKELKAFDIFGSYASLAIHKNKLLEETEEALSIRDLFIAMAAHELRTPITTISGYSQLLHSKLSGADTPESRWVDELVWESSRLVKLVNELLAVNRIKTGQLQYILKECSLKEVIERAVSDFRFTHPDHKVVFYNQVNSSQALVIGDFEKLIQVLLNLLDNAAKFSPAKETITINLKFKPSYLVLQVKDYGKGIDKKDLPKVFEGFYKGRDPSREGMGLGLFLAKSIIEEHRGSIHIHSKVGKGTIVEVQLPKINQ